MFAIRRTVYSSGGMTLHALKHLLHAASSFALESNDLAAVKLLVGRPKDISLVLFLHQTGRISAETVRERIDALPIPVELIPRLLANFRTAMEPADI